MPLASGVSVDTGDVLGGGIHIGNNGMNNAQVDSIFSSIAAQDIARDQEEKANERKRFLLLIGASGYFLILLLIIFFIYQKRTQNV